MTCQIVCSLFQSSFARTKRSNISHCDDDAVAILPLIHSLENSHQWIQNWYADESSCVGELLSVRKWYDRLLPNGPAYGFFPEPSKIVLVVQSLARSTEGQ